MLLLYGGANKLLDGFSEEFLKLRKALLEKRFSNLNKRQQEAVFNVNGPMVVLAGAGSGKTTAIINRIVNMVDYGDAYTNNLVNESEVTEENISLLKNAYNGFQNIESVNYLLKLNPVDPRNILSITFTNKAASELKNRLKQALGEKSRDVCSCTFHSFCSRVLRTHALRLGYSSHFTIYDDEDSTKVIKECLKMLKLDDKVTTPKNIKNAISRMKDKLIDFKDYKLSLKDSLRNAMLSDIYEYYQNKLIEADAMDFDDLIFNTVKLFQNYPEILESYRDVFKYILVDEYQDTNYAQYVLIKSLAEKSGNLCVVGDDDQSIYKFRGATIENIIDFEKIFPRAKVIKFEQNYRSSKNIIEAANSIINNNIYRKGKELWTNNCCGEPIRIHTAYSEHDEANFIAEAIQDRVAKGEKYSDFAVLYRRNLQSNVIEKVFMRRSIPYRVFGGQRFYDRKEIKDMIAYLSVINNPLDEVRLKRIINQPRRSIGERTIAQASEIAKETNSDLFTVMKNCEMYDSLQRVSVKLKSFSNLIDELMYIYASGRVSVSELYEILLEKTQYINFLKSERDNSESKIENVKEFLNSIKSYEEEKGKDATLSGFLEEISLFSDIDNYDLNADAVILMTLHSAKGLEFPNVFLPGLEEGIFPSIQAIDDEVELEEERRLAYVGVTRCKKSLYLLNSDSRMLAGITSHNKASRFLCEIPQEIVKKTKSRDWKDLKEGEPIPESAQEQRVKSVMAAHNFGGIAGGKSNLSKKGEISSSDIFEKDMMVNHGSFGDGKILSSVEIGGDHLLTIDFGGSIGSKRLLANFANLKKI